MKKLFICQSNYIPWAGYFSTVAQCDELIMLDSVQYTRRDWRNRNQIKTPSGNRWLSVPVNTKGLLPDLRISQTRIMHDDWTVSHLNKIKESYRDAPCFDEVFGFLTECYGHVVNEPFLSKVNLYLTQSIFSYLGLSWVTRQSTDYLTLTEQDTLTPTDRLVQLCLKAGAGIYVSGPAAKQYIEEDRFLQAGIELQWADYGTLVPYKQLYGPYDPYVSIIDLLMMHGRDSSEFL